MVEQWAPNKTRRTKQSSGSHPVVKVDGQERQTFENSATVVLVEYRDDYVELKKFQEYPSSVPLIQEKPLLRESVYELSYGSISEKQVILAWVRDGNGGFGNCRKKALDGIRSAIKGDAQFELVISAHVGFSEIMRKGDLAVAGEICDATDPPVPDDYPSRKLCSLVRRKVINATMATFEFDNRKVTSTSQFGVKNMFIDQTLGIFFG